MFINGRFEVSKVPCIFTSVGCVLPGSDASSHASFTYCVVSQSFDAATLSIKLTCYHTRSHHPRCLSEAPPIIIKAVGILGPRRAARYLGDKHNNYQKYNYPSVG